MAKKIDWEKIRQEWETTKITFKALAEKHNVKEGTLKSRRSREKWSRDATKKKDATIQKKMQQKKERYEPVVESDNLTEKQRLFCIYYIKYFNATKAYQKAYECAYTTARVEGSRHLANPNIKAEIQRMKDEQTSELMLDARDVIQKYIDIAFADITDFVEFGTEEREERNSDGITLYDDAGNPKTYMANYVRFKDYDEIDGTIVTEVKQGKDGVSVKLADKMRALDMLAKYTQLLTDEERERLEKEKVKASIEKTKAETSRIKGDEGEEYEDDGFLDAIKSSVDVWGDNDD